MRYLHSANYIHRTLICRKLYLCVSHSTINSDHLPKNINRLCVLCDVGPEIFNITETN
jgi:hypothetical protein